MNGALQIVLPEDDFKGSLGDREARQRRLQLVEQPSNRAPHMVPLLEMVDDLRRERGADAAPWFDPCDGGTHARILILLSDPGPKSLVSTFISSNNRDPSANRVWDLRDLNRLPRTEYVHWNIIPWKREKNGGLTPDESNRALPWLQRFFALLPRLQVVIAMGKVANDRKGLLGEFRSSCEKSVAWLEGVHPSMRARNGLHTRERWLEQPKLYAQAASLLKD